MYTAGIDAGMSAIKAVVLDNNNRIASALIVAGKKSTALVADEVLSSAASKLNIPVSAIKHVAVTGRAREYVPIGNSTISEAICLAKGIYFLMPDIATAFDVGASKTLAIRCKDGKPMKTATNDKCAAGNGIFLELVSEILHIQLNDMAKVASMSTIPVEVESTCAVFAESEIISLIHMQKKTEDILKGVLQALASRIFSLLNSLPYEKEIAMVGGVAKNQGLVQELETLFGIPINIPEQPEMVVAIGAALTAMENTRL